jgi:hypothetical protein
LSQARFARAVQKWTSWLSITTEAKIIASASPAAIKMELETRVNQTEADKKDAVQVINILPFEKPDH